MLTKYKTKLLMTEPFFGYLLLKLKFIEDESVKTMAVDGVNFWYAPSFIRENTFDHVLGVIVHELLHCVLMHISRGALHNPQLSNIAADYVVNWYIINKTNFTLPECALYDDRFSDMSYDAVYQILYDENKGKADQDQVNQSEQMGTFEPRKNEDVSDDTGGLTLEDYWVSNIHEAAKIIQTIGLSNSPLVEELLLSTVPPQLPWTRILKRFIKKTVKSNSTWNRPNRRFAHRGMFLPSKGSKNLDVFIFIWDTSCSVTNVQFQHGLAEVNQVAKTMSPSKIIIIQCDDKVAKVETFLPKDYPIKTTIVGRRCTAFKPAFDYIEENNLKPNCVVYFTDLQGSTDFKPPPYPVLWVNTAYPNNTQPEFGTVIGLNLQ